MRTRLATTGDAAAIARVHVATWQAAYRGVLPQAYLDALQPADRLPLWETELSAPTGATVVAEHDSEVVGFAHVGPDRDADGGGRPRADARLYALYVLPAYWGSGAGRALLERAVEAYDPTRPVRLWVLEDNPRARRFYETAGFTQSGSPVAIELGGAHLTEVAYVRPPSR